MRRSKKLTGALTVGAAVLIAACGGAGDAGDGGDGDGATTPTAPSLTETTVGADADQKEDTKSDEAKAMDYMLEYAECMRENGVDYPDPTGELSQNIDLSGVSQDTLKAAEEACNPILEKAEGDFELTPEQEARQRDADLAFTRCLRERGIEVPDAKPGEPMMIPQGDKEKTEAAMDDCTKEAYSDMNKETP